MEKNNLDNFFAEKLSQRTFEFNPEHWEAAEKLIELQEQQDDRGKRFGWWILLIPLIGLLGVLGYFAKAELNSPQPTTLDISQSGMTQSGINLFDNTTTNNQTKITTLSESKTSDILNSSNSKNDIQANKTNDTKTNVNDFSTNSNSEKVEMKNATETAYPKSTNSNFPTTTENNHTTVTEKPATTKASSDVETAMTDKGTIKAIPSEFNGNKLQPLIPDSTSQNIKQLEPQARDQASTMPVELNRATFITRKPVVSTPDEAVATSTSNELLDLPDLVAAVDELNPAGKEFVIVTNTKKQKKKIDIGFMAGTLIYSTKSNGIDTLAARSTTSTRIGLTTGLTFGFNISDHFSIHADALYQWRKEALGVISSTRGEAYGFGLVNTTTQTHPQSFHSIELPVYLQYSYGGHSLEAGVACRHLLAIKGIDKSEAIPELPVNNSVEMTDRESILFDQQDVWIPEGKYKRFTASYMLGYRYWLNDRFNIGLRATYTPSAKPSASIFNPSESDAQTFSTQTNSLNFGLNAKWYFN